MALIHTFFGKPPVGTSKVSHGWWSSLHNCHTRDYSANDFSQYLQMLFDRGYGALFGTQQADDPLNEPTDIFSGRTKTVRVVLNKAQIDAIEQRARLKSMSFQDVVGHCLRLGYVIAC